MEIKNPHNFPQHQYNERDYFLAHEKLLRFLARSIATQDKRILDVGSATGLLFLLMNHKEHDVYGIDVEQDFMDVFEDRFGIGHAKACNIENENLPHNDNEFDLVICNSILEHTLNPKHLISEVSRVLKPGGRALFVVPNALAFMRRWNLLRGRNVFTPLIDNLLHKTYQKRCAVFYSPKDIRMAMDPLFKTVKVDFFNDEGELENNHLNFFKSSFIHIVRYFFPEWRDTIIVEVKK